MGIFKKKDVPQQETAPQPQQKNAEDRLKSLEEDVLTLSQELTTLQKQLNRVERKVYRNIAEDGEENNSTSSNTKNLPGMVQGDFSWIQRGWRG